MINVNHLVLRRDKPDGLSQHTDTFCWPESGFVGVRPQERLSADRGCGPGLYGYSCAPDKARRMNLDWSGSVWRLILAIHEPVDLGNKVKYEAGHVLFAGTAQECRDLVWELGGDVPSACLGVDPDNRRPGFDKIAIVAAIHAGADARAADVGLWRVFRSIGAAGSPEALRERATREWIAVGIPAGDARYMSGQASAAAAAAYFAGWAQAYDQHDLQVLALAGWTHARTAWVGDPTDPAIREYLLANPTATDLDVRIAALAAERLPARLATAPSLYDARRLYARAVGETVRAIAVDRKPSDASLMRSAERSIGLYIGSIRPVAPDYWIDAKILARLIKRKPDLAVVRYNWTVREAKLKAANAKRRAGTRKRQIAAMNKARAAERALEDKRDALVRRLDIKCGPKSWGRTTSWAVRLAGSGAAWRTIGYPPETASYAAVLGLVHECELTAGDRHV